ncbi:hypothetical protein ABBQ32_002929 [Trebouxia sp. C0010 RCD-2024]
MRSALAFNDSLSVSTVDNSEVQLIRLAGQAGPVVLFLHANGFHVKCYVPLAQRIAKGGYQCWGLEFRGQGGAVAPPGNLVELYLSDLNCATETLSLRGCYAFAHSGGAQVAIRAEAQNPGTFAAIYAYEPVYLPSGGGSSFEQNVKVFEGLAAAARRRKATFNSRQDAAQRYRARPPFSTFNQRCFQQYVQHGLTQLQDGTCTLTISTENEARWYVAAGRMAISGSLEDPPNVRCPLVIAVGMRTEGEAMNFLGPAGIQQTRRFPKGRSERFHGLGHLGPLEDPITVASRALHCFDASRQQSAWAALPRSETIQAAQLSAKL